jgi:hypothetical protein
MIDLLETDHYFALFLSTSIFRLVSTELNILNITKVVLIVVEPSLLFTSMSPLYFSHRTNPLNGGLNPIAARKLLPFLLLPFLLQWNL